MTGSVAEDQIKSFVRRVESLEDEIKVLNEDKSEVYKEAKSTGFDVKVLRRVIADRRKDSAERDEFDAVYDLYWSAIHGVVSARVEIIEKFDADGVEIEPQPPVAPDQHVEANTVAQDGLTAGHTPTWALTPPDARQAVTFISKPRRPYCQRPEMCGGQGAQHCYACEKSRGGNAA